jgi:hypothetical protein
MDVNQLIPSNLQRLHKAVRDGLSIAVARIRARERWKKSLLPVAKDHTGDHS